MSLGQDFSVPRFNAIIDYANPKTVGQQAECNRRKLGSELASLKAGDEAAKGRKENSAATAKRKKLASLSPEAKEAYINTGKLT